VEHKNFLQSAEFAKWRELCGDEVAEVAGNYMVIKNAKRGRHAEIAGAIIAATDSAPKPDLSDFAAQVRVAAKEHDLVYVRVRPQLSATEANLAAFKHAGFRPAARHLYAENTVILDLTKSEEEILAEMRKQTRYEIRHLDRYPDLRVELVDMNDDAANLTAWEDFAAMQAATAKRQGFVAPKKSELLNLRAAFGDKALLYRAKASGDVLAYALVVLGGTEADYFEAASLEAARDIPVAYALQWRIIRDMKTRGLQYYNLFGIAPEGAVHHRYAKLTTFKRGFGGEVVNYLPAQDLPIQGVKYRLLHLYELEEKRRMKW
jgi:lipid II:glycine glycyltransferase (peptidoglycan interpeptide bridge formation enzyme)